MSDPLLPNTAKPKPEDPSIWAALQLAWELGYIIALPAVILGFGGAYLDAHHSTSPLFLALGFIIAFTVSFLGVLRKIRKIIPQ